MNEAKITDRIFTFAKSLVGHIPGGLGHVNVVASMIFAGMSGSGLADTSGLGKVEIKAMKDDGYDPAFSAAVTASSAIIGPIIPPSICMVVGAVVTNTSVGRMLVGGVIPGVMMGTGLMLVVYFLSKKRGYPRMERETLGKETLLGPVQGPVQQVNYHGAGDFRLRPGLPEGGEGGAAVGGNHNPFP